MRLLFTSIIPYRCKRTDRSYDSYPTLAVCGVLTTGLGLMGDFIFTKHPRYEQANTR